MQTINISELHQQTQNIREQIAQYEATHEPSQYRVWPYVMEAIAEYGAENIFLVGESYHGGYHDDYCDFTYYNNVTGEQFRDNWTTAFACPSYDCYKCLTLKDAFANGLVNLSVFIQMKRENLQESIDRQGIPHLSIDDYIKNKMLVSVEKGRKWKGTGYVIGERRMRFGYKEVVYASVYDPLKDDIFEVNEDYLIPVGIEAMLESWKAEMTARLNVATTDDLHVSEDGNCTNDLCVPFKSWLIIKGKDVSFDASAAKDMKKAEFKTKKMDQLRAWVLENTDKTGKDVEVLAEHIYNRRYA